MTQYIKQRDKFRCGPIAVFNSLRWAGADISARYVYELTDKCNTKHFGQGGTDHHDFDRVLREEAAELVKIDLILKPRMYEIEEHLKNGGALVLNFAYNRDELVGVHRHYTLLTEISETGKTLEMVNGYSNRPAVQKIRRKTFVTDCLSHTRDKDAKAWFLTKV